MTKLQAMWESAYRTFLQAALPAFVGVLVATDGFSKAALYTAVIAGASAGLAAVARLLRPIKTDQVGVGVSGTKQAPLEGVFTDG